MLSDNEHSTELPLVMVVLANSDIGTIESVMKQVDTYSNITICERSNIDDISVFYNRIFSKYREEVDYFLFITNEILIGNNVIKRLVDKLDSNTSFKAIYTDSIIKEEVKIRQYLPPYYHRLLDSVIINNPVFVASTIPQEEIFIPGISSLYNYSAFVRISKRRLLLHIAEPLFFTKDNVVLKKDLEIIQNDKIS